MLFSKKIFFVISYNGVFLLFFCCFLSPLFWQVSCNEKNGAIFLFHTVYLNQPNVLLLRIRVWTCKDKNDPINYTAHVKMTLRLFFLVKILIAVYIMFSVLQTAIRFDTFHSYMVCTQFSDFRHTKSWNLMTLHINTKPNSKKKWNEDTIFVIFCFIIRDSGAQNLINDIFF